MSQMTDHSCLLHFAQIEKKKIKWQTLMNTASENQKNNAYNFPFIHTCQRLTLIWGFCGRTDPLSSSEPLSSSAGYAQSNISTTSSLPEVIFLHFHLCMWEWRKTRNWYFGGCIPAKTSLIKYTLQVILLKIEWEIECAKKWEQSPIILRQWFYSSISQPSCHMP